MLEDETFENFFAKSAKEEGGGVQKMVEKTRYLRRDAFVDNPLLHYYLNYFLVSDVTLLQIIFWGHKGQPRK